MKANMKRVKAHPVQGFSIRYFEIPNGTVLDIVDIIEKDLTFPDGQTKPYDKVLYRVRGCESMIYEVPMSELVRMGSAVPVVQDFDEDHVDIADSIEILSSSERPNGEGGYQFPSRAYKGWEDYYAMRIDKHELLASGRLENEIRPLRDYTVKVL